MPEGVILAVTALLLIAGGIKASRYAATVMDISVTVCVTLFYNQAGFHLSQTKELFRIIKRAEPGPTQSTFGPKWG